MRKSLYFNRLLHFGRLIVAVSLMVTLLPVAASLAQNVSDEHLKQARAAVTAIRATERFDAFLGSTARELKNELMRKDPNWERLISQTVEEEALKLAARRSDLEREVARIYAKYFSQEELKQIADFYNSDAGQKLITQGPNAVIDADGAYNIWRQGIAQDLAANSGRALAQKINQMRLEAAQNAGSEAAEDEAPSPEPAQ